MATIAMRRGEREEIEAQARWHEEAAARLSDRERRAAAEQRLGELARLWE